jgi:hypothetical protein
MKVITPLDLINGGFLTSSSIADGTSPDPALWVASTSYVIGDRVRLASTKKIYENIVAGVNSTSPDISAISDTPKWAEIGYTNKWAMFDTLRNSASRAAGDISIVVTPGKRIDSVALLNLVNVSSVVVTVTSSSTIVYSNTITTGAAELVITDLPPFTNMVISVVLSGPGTIEVGSVLFGNAEYIGELQYGARIGSNNFSTVNRDSFGTASLVQRGSVPKLSLTLIVKSGFIDRILSVRNSLNATPAVWIGLNPGVVSEYFGPLLILGFYNTFSIQLTSPIHATITLEIEEI